MKLVITPHRPVRKALTAIAALLAIVLGFAFAMDYGHWKSIATAMVSTGEKRGLLNEVVALRKSNESLQFELAKLRRAEEIAANTRREHHDEKVAMQSEIATLRGEIEFYRDVFSAAGVESGPRVKGLRIVELAGEGRFGYRLVMTYLNKDARTTEGALDFDLMGELDGRREALGFAEIVESGPKELTFKFKHFFMFEGTLKIPQGFVPRQVEVAVKRQGKKREGARQTYDWASVIN